MHLPNRENRQVQMNRKHRPSWKSPESARNLLYRYIGADPTLSLRMEVVLRTSDREVSLSRFSTFSFFPGAWEFHNDVAFAILDSTV